jgi:hypothetical protein
LFVRRFVFTLAFSTLAVVALLLGSTSGGRYAEY